MPAMLRGEKLISLAVTEPSGSSDVAGLQTGSNRFRTDMPRLIQFYQQGGLLLDRMIPGHLKLE